MISYCQAGITPEKCSLEVVYLFTVNNVTANEKLRLPLPILQRENIMTVYVLQYPSEVISKCNCYYS